MSNEEFFITLPSNASFKDFPENTKSNFKTKLYKTIQLTVPYEVALIEILYPRQQNLSYQLGKITIRRENTPELIEKYETNLKIDREYSKIINTEDIKLESFNTYILFEINNLIEKMQIDNDNSHKIYYKLITKFSFTLPDGFSLEFNGVIAEILGF